MPQFVLTHAEPSSAAPGFTFLGGDIGEAVNTVKAAARGKYVAILGQNVARQLLEADLLDEILVHLAPVLLGDGIRMFVMAGGTNVGLERIQVTESPTVTDLWFSVLK